jgi:hypothetical protein
VAASKMNRLISHADMARRYYDWARNQFDLAERSPNPKVRADRLALAEYYLKLADQEVAAGRTVASPRAASESFRSVLRPEASPAEARPTGVAG